MEINSITQSTNHTTLETIRNSRGFGLIREELPFLHAKLDLIIDELPYDSKTLPWEDLKSNLDKIDLMISTSMDLRYDSFDFFKTRADKVIRRIVIESILYDSCENLENLPPTKELVLLREILISIYKMEDPLGDSLNRKLVSDEVTIDLLRGFITLRFEMIHEIHDKSKSYTLESMLASKINLKSRRRLLEFYSQKDNTEAVNLQYQLVSSIIEAIMSNCNPSSALFNYYYDLLRFEYIVGINSFCHELNLAVGKLVTLDINVMDAEESRRFSEIKTSLKAINYHLKSNTKWKNSTYSSQVTRFLNNYKKICRINKSDTIPKKSSSSVHTTKKTVIKSSEKVKHIDNRNFRYHLHRSVHEPEWVKNFFGTQINVQSDTAFQSKNMYRTEGRCSCVSNEKNVSKVKNMRPKFLKKVKKLLSKIKLNPYNSMLKVCNLQKSSGNTLLRSSISQSLLVK